MLPEVLIKSVLEDADIPTYSNLNGFGTEDTFVVMLRDSSTRQVHDLARVFKTKTYNLTLHCMSSGGKKAAAELCETVADILDDLYWLASVGEVSVSGGRALPKMGSYEGYSVSVSLELT